MPKVSFLFSCAPSAQQISVLRLPFVLYEKSGKFPSQAVPALERGYFPWLLPSPGGGFSLPHGLCAQLITLLPCSVSLAPWLRKLPGELEDSPTNEFKAEAVVGVLAVAGLACVGSMAGVSVVGVWACCLFSFPAW